MLKNISLFAINHGLIRWLFYLFRLYYFTCRLTVVNDAPVFRRLSRGEKVIVSIWHQRILAVFPYALRFSSYLPSVMISRSRDGELASQLFACMNFRPVRGSSSRGGKEALSSLIEDLKSHPAVHVVDGPRGPRGIIKPGLVTLGQISQVPIYPISVSANRAWVLKSWDRCLIPKPFSRITISLEAPISVPQELDAENFERVRLEIQNRMLLSQIRQDASCGWGNLFD